MSVANVTVLVTGAGGSIGSVLTKKLLTCNAAVKAFDIDEYSLATLSEAAGKDTLLETYLGDIKDVGDVERAVRNCNIIIHLAAVKMVDVSSSHPIPCIETNIRGTINIVNEALRQEVNEFLFISSDKAVNFGSVYGATKFIGERLTLHANFFEHGKFSVCRFGNVIESRGNVFEIWRRQKEKGETLSVTHPKMERYFWHVDEATAFILKALLMMQGGEIFIPKMQKYKIVDLAHQVSPDFRIVGIRPEELLDAKLYADYEKPVLEDLGDMWVIRQ